VLSQIGELYDSGLIDEYSTKFLIRFVFNNNNNLSIISDILLSRNDNVGRAQFLKFFIEPQVMSPPSSSIPIVPPVGFNWSDTASPIDPVVAIGRTNSSAIGPTLIIPRAIRLSGPPEIPKDSPDSMKSTNPGSSIDVSPPNVLSLTRDTTGTSQPSPPKEWKNALVVMPCDNGNRVVHD
jgi:hypothetical protein